MRIIDDTKPLADFLDSLLRVDLSGLDDPERRRLIVFQIHHNVDSIYLLTKHCRRDVDAVSAAALNDLEAESLFLMELTNRILFKCRIPLLGCNSDTLSDVRARYASLVELSRVLVNCINPYLDSYLEYAFFAD